MMTYSPSPDSKSSISHSQKEKFRSIGKTKYSLGIPLLLVSLMVFMLSFDVKGQNGETPDVMPEYKGGIARLYRTIQKSIKYPQEARKENIQGQVFVSFTVNSKGRVVDIQTNEDKFNMLEEIVVVGYVYEGVPWKVSSDLTMLQKECRRTVALLGKFTPGKKDGIPVGTRLTIPVTFKLRSGNY